MAGNHRVRLIGLSQMWLHAARDTVLMIQVAAESCITSCCLHNMVMINGEPDRPALPHGGQSRPAGASQCLCMDPL